ncbi:MAG: MOSC N-terminal beta barrel domain-containing protein [Nocardioides sp.]|uniref:MOSC domain-containing protein n=1 Tax=Nocardioides sp. TaxID=35761 RepID=UPI0039E6C802
MTLCALWRYPVKSLGGERLTGADVRPEEPLPGDRAWAIRDDATGEIISAKRDPRILYAWATTHDDGVSVSVPGLASPMPVAQAGPTLSAWLGRRVSMCDTSSLRPETTFDFGFRVDLGSRSYGDSGNVLHLVSTATLRALGDLVPGITPAEAVRRTRPNLVVDLGPEPFAEDQPAGSTLMVGEVVLRVVGRTGRCMMVDRAQPGVPRAALLDLLTERRDGALGVYVTVRQGGRLEVGVEPPVGVEP